MRISCAYTTRTTGAPSTWAFSFTSERVMIKIYGEEKRESSTPLLGLVIIKLGYVCRYKEYKMKKCQRHMCCTGAQLVRRVVWNNEERSALGLGRPGAELLRLACRTYERLREQTECWITFVFSIRYCILSYIKYAVDANEFIRFRDILTV